MSATQQSKDPVLVVLQLTGGNDYLNTVIPYNNGLYKDNRKAVGISDSDMIHLDQAHAIPNYMAPLKKFWDDDKLAIMHGVGYLDSPRSHFRSMDIWHTCEAEKVGTEGWLGRVVREFDPRKENVITAVSFGPCLFRALSVPGVPVACVAGPLEQYGFLPTIRDQAQRLKVLESFARMPFLAQVEQAKLRRFVEPGAMLAIDASLVHLGSGYAVTQGKVESNGAVVAEAEIRFRTLPFPSEETRELMLAHARRLGLEPPMRA